MLDFYRSWELLIQGQSAVSASSITLATKLHEAEQGTEEDSGEFKHPSAQVKVNKL